MNEWIVLAIVWGVPVFIVLPLLVFIFTSEEE
jgi:hypothetical protein